MTESYWQEDCRKPPVNCDVAVIGGGILGVSTAYWLRKEAPDLQVALLEANRLASGASGRNAGFILQGGASNYVVDRQRHGAKRARLVWDFTRENRDLLVSEVDAHAVQLSKSGSLTVAGDEEEDARLRSSVSHLRRNGVPAAYFPPEEVSERIAAEGFMGGLYIPSGAMVHPVRLIRALASRRGLQVLEHHRFLSYRKTVSGVILTTPFREVRARRVVFCLGAAITKHFPYLRRRVRPVRAQMLATEPGRMWLQVPVYSHSGYYYIRQVPDGSVLVGGARHLHQDEERGFDDRTTVGVQRDIEQYLSRHFPKAASLRVQKRWSGIMSFSPDGLPVIGRIPDLKGSFWMAGCTGHGMAYGFRLGRLMARQLQGQSDKRYWSIFSDDRFKKTVGNTTAA